MADLQTVIHCAGPLILTFLRIPRGAGVPAWIHHNPFASGGIPSDVYQLAAALDDAQTELDDFGRLYEFSNVIDHHMVCPDRLYTIRATPGYFAGLRSKVAEHHHITQHPRTQPPRGHMLSFIVYL